ncbi:hypothetical protein SAMN04487891_10244 [Flagellimonas taeanensis]|uniref:Uncharacterized protein n=1 Tax=Flagellimonas taeanensis TaxID=1005926 RepID=A0A1M6RDG5_9FLAO|nr:hypothetical protein [Allomuricauda taeanensis]SFB74988.1 hypothetical protein SAMN04487891_10244 [Allomuricauda taeanensis]SHK30509.1 hypothetical protein SAMN05216293_0720 [Allomuricauda taeanensis]
MRKKTVNKRHQKGDLVFAKVRPCVTLVVRLYVRKVYYCTIQNNTTASELVYLESELRPYIANLSATKHEQLTL